MTRAGLVRLALLTAALAAAMGAYTAPLRPGIPALQLTFVAAHFDAILAAWQAPGRQRFLRHFALDFPFLLAYGLLGLHAARASAAVARLPAPLRAGVTWSLPVAALADAVENGLHLQLLLGAAPHGAGLYLAAGLAASAKWLLVAAGVGGAAVAVLAAWLARRSAV